MQEKNWDFQPAGNSSGNSRWVKVVPSNPKAKTTTPSHFLLPDGTQASFIQGYLCGIGIEEKEENKQYSIPARTEYTLTIEVRPGEKWNVSFSDHWKSSATSSVLNTLAGQSADWDKFIQIALYDKDGLMRASCKDQSGNWLNKAYPYNAETGRLDGVPGIDEDGTFKKVNEFWKSVAKYAQKQIFSGSSGESGIEPAIEKKAPAPVPASQANSVLPKTFAQIIEQEIGKKATGMEDEAKMQEICNKAKYYYEQYEKKYGAISAHDNFEAREILVNISHNAGLNAAIGKNWEFSIVAADDLPF
jgi:hypothetical protein